MGFLYLFPSVRIAAAAILTILLTCSNDSVGYEFSRDYFGVSFSGYIKDFEGNGTTTPAFTTYTLGDMKVMMKVVSTRFAKIATYGSGANPNNLNSTWDKGDGGAFIARAAALVNKEANKTLITMAQGLYQNTNPIFMQKEIQYGFDEAKDANSIWPGTVWGIIFFNLYVTNEDDGQVTLNALRKHKDEAKKLGIKVGTRINSCGQINGGEIKGLIRTLAKESDYLMCNIHPSDKTGFKIPMEVVREIGEIYWSFATPLKKVNPNLEVLIGDTGWPSAGISYSGTHNNLRNMRDFWYEMDKWASKNKVRVQIFEAFDEPWKSDIRKTDEKDPSGKYGGERHFGWFKLVNNSRISEDTIVEKVSELVETKVWVWILVSVIVVLLICTIILAIFYIQYRKQQRTFDQLAEADIEEFERGVPEAVQGGAATPENHTDLARNFPYNRSYEILKQDLTIYESEILGSGEFGMVYKGLVTKQVTQQTAAIKTTKPNCSAGPLKALLSEIKTMIYIGRHQNIVQFVGAYTAELRQGILYVVMEYCPGGSLESHLRKLRENLEPNNVNVLYENVGNSGSKSQSSNLIPSSIRDNLIKWSYETACGMEFLANRNVIHADLATRNILLDGNQDAKITDFGLSRRLYEYTEYVKKNQEPLPWRWMSPESLHSMTFSTQSDIWSYGITLWEIFSLGDLPYPGLSWTTNFLDRLFMGMKPGVPKYAPAELYKTMALCWEIKPENRPSFTTLKDLIMQQMLTEPRVPNNSEKNDGTFL